MNNGIPILMYNGFYTNTRKTKVKTGNISVKLFASQMEYLYQNGYKCITLEDAETAIKRNIFPEKSFCITFDNGFYSQIKYAVPILSQYDWKATFFIPTLVIGEKNRKKLRQKYELELHPSDKMMDWNHLESLIKSEHFVQSHGCYHHPNNVNDVEMMELEVFESKHVLEHTLGYEIEYFAYPFGAYNNKMIQMLKKANYQLAFTTYPGIMSPNDDLYRIPRIGFNSADTLETTKLKLSTGYNSNSEAMMAKAKNVFFQTFFIKDIFVNFLKKLAR